ncbi:MAG: ATP-binding protein [Pseudomonadota bacterium]
MTQQIDTRAEAVSLPPSGDNRPTMFQAFFDEGGRAVGAAPYLSQSGRGSDEKKCLRGYLSTFALIDGKSTGSPRVVAEARARWQAGEVLVGETEDSSRYLLSAHPRPEGGRVYVGAPMPSNTEDSAPTVPVVDRDEAAFLQNLLTASPANLLLSRLEDGEVLYRSPASRRLFGDTCDAGLHWDIQEERETYIAMLREKGEVEDFFRIGRGADGRPFPSLVSSRLLEHNGELVILSSTTDLTEPFALRDASDLANARLRDAIESLDEAFVLYDADDRLVMANRLYRDAHREAAHAIRPGASSQEILAALVKADHLEGGETLIEEFRAELTEGRQHRPRQMELRRRDGRVFLFRRSPTKEGGSAVTLLDITERKRADEAEREADALVRTIVEACPTTFLVSRVSDGKIIYAPPPTRERYGNLRTTLGFFIKPEDRQRYLDALLPTGSLTDFPNTFRRRDGSIMKGLTSACVTEYKGEAIIVSSTRDITDELAMREELERQREIAHQNEKLSALGGLLAGVAHELNNPLSIVVGYALMLREKIDDPVFGRRVERIGQAAERCAKIVKTFLSMARQRPARIETVPLEGLIATAVDIAGYGIQSLGGQIHFDPDPDLPNVAVDADQMVQVFSNLIANAEHALAPRGADGLLTISASHGKREQTVRVVLSDNGDGIPEDIQARIFEPFFTTKEVGAGTGVGLAFCHRIVNSHGGSLCVESVPGDGATFIVTLPVATTEDEAEVPESAPGLREGVGRVLVIDDEPDVAEMIADLLTEQGYEVTASTDPEEALAYLDLGQFDAVLSDIKMPGIGGQGVLDLITRNHPRLVARLAFVTGDAMSTEVARFLTESGRPHLEKPVAPEELQALVAKLCDGDGETE